jgi:Ca2+-binding RTX toxin-like protein
MFGEDDRDDMEGGRGADRMNGGDGNDRIAGGLGGDRLTGGDGNDRIDGGDGRNTYSGGDGNDAIDAANGSTERIRCGAGRDVVRADATDRLSGCERVFRLNLVNP